METTTPEDLLKNFTDLPPEAQQEALHFIEFLRFRYLPKKTTESSETGNLEDEPFIGVWKGREDMQDSSEWVRDLRRQEWS